MRDPVGAHDTEQQISSLVHTLLSNPSTSPLYEVAKAELQNNLKSLSQTPEVPPEALSLSERLEAGTPASYARVYQETQAAQRCESCRHAIAPDGTTLMECMCGGPMYCSKPCQKKCAPSYLLNMALA